MNDREDPWIYSVATFPSLTRDGLAILVARHQDGGDGRHYNFQRLNASLDWESVIDLDGRYIQFEDQPDPIIIPSVAITAAPDVTRQYLANIGILVEDPRVRDSFLEHVGLIR